MEEKPSMESMVKLARILVTGDRGYIGAVLVKKLISKNYKVTGIDSGFFENDLSASSKPKYKIIKKDIRRVQLEDLKNIDAVIHLCALSNDPMGEIDPKLTEEINYKASVRLAKLAKKAGVKRFIFSSSCSIYGIAENGIVDEKSKINPLTAYAKSKIKTEKALKKLASKNFYVIIMRNSTVYGFSNKFRNDLVVNNLVTTALAYNQLRILSDGTPWRPLIDVRDLADIFIEFLKTEKGLLNGTVINIGFNENNFRVKDIVKLINKYLVKCEVIYTGEHGKDSRSYKVKFDLFNKYFPAIRQKWPLERSIKDLIVELKKAGFNKRNFEEGDYTRLAMLKKLKDDGKIDSKFFWK